MTKKKADTSLPELRRTCGDWFPEEQDAALEMIDALTARLSTACVGCGLTRDKESSVEPRQDGLARCNDCERSYRRKREAT